jgi:hypothetical protein
MIFPLYQNGGFWRSVIPEGMTKFVKDCAKLNPDLVFRHALKKGELSRDVAIHSVYVSSVKSDAQNS